MPIFYPDILQNNNSNYPIADITDIKGNAYPITNLTDTGSIPSTKRKIGTIIFVSSVQKFYGYYGTTTGSADWNSGANWKELAVGSALTGYITTGTAGTTQILSGSLTIQQGITGSVQSASFTPNAFVSASYVNGNLLLVKGNLDSSSFSINSGSFTGSLLGTASYATNALTASFFSGSISNAVNALSSSYPLELTGSADTSTIYSYGSNLAGGTTYNVSPRDNIQLGVYSGLNVITPANTAHTGSIFLGKFAGTNSGTNVFSVFIGRSAGEAISSPTLYGIGIGPGAANNAFGVTGSTFIGYNAGQYSSRTLYSNFIGYEAGKYTTGSNYSTIIGYLTAYNPSSNAYSPGENNIIIGTGITLDRGRRDSINIGGLIFGTGSHFNTNLNINSLSGSAGGRVGINVPNPRFGLDVEGTVRFGTLLQSSSANLISYNAGTGEIYYVSTSSLAVSTFPFNGAAVISGSLTLTGSLNVLGTASFTNVVYENIQVVNAVSTGSNTFGDTPDDIQRLIGTTRISGSLVTSGSAIVSGTLSVSNGITASLFGTSSWASTASVALNSVSASFATSASWAPTTAAGQNDEIQYNSGSRLQGISTFKYISTSQSFQQGFNTNASGRFSHAEGSGSITIGSASHAEGVNTTVYGVGSHAEGFNTYVAGQYSHTEGSNSRVGTIDAYGATITFGVVTISSTYGTLPGEFSPNDLLYVKDGSTNAVNLYTISESTTSGPNRVLRLFNGGVNISPAIVGNAQKIVNWNGDLTIESRGSHAKGDSTQVLADFASAAGQNTIAVGDYQYVLGKYNLPTTLGAAFIIGNGTTDSNRKNLVVAAGNNFGITGSLYVTGSTYLTGLTSESKTFILTYDDTTGQIFYTASSAIGGTGGNLSNYVANSQTGSFVTNAQTSSLVANSQTGSFVVNSQTGSFVANSQTASFVTNSQTGSFVVNSQTSSFVTNNQTGSFVTNEQTSSLVANSQTASFVTNTQTSSFVVNSQTSSFVTNSQTASFVVNSQTASFVTNAQTSSFATTGSNAFIGNQNISGTLFISGVQESNGTGHVLTYDNTTGKVTFTSSAALGGGTGVPGGNSGQIQYNNAGAFAGLSNLTFDGTTLRITGSFSGSAVGYVTNTQTSSFVTNDQTASLVSNTQTSSFVTNSQTASFVTTNQTASFVTNIQTGSFVVNSQTSSLVSNTQTGSFVLNSQTASFVTNSQTGSFVLESETGSFVVNSQTASFITNAQTSSFVLETETGSFATTGSNTFIGNQTISGTLSISGAAASVGTGHVLTYNTGTGVVTYISTASLGGGTGTPGGSNGQIQYNNAGAFGGVNVLTFDGTNLIATGSFSGSVFGYVANNQTASFVTNSQTASLVSNTQTGSFVLNSQTASFVTNSQTSSFVTNNQTASLVTNSQTASFVTNTQTSSFVNNTQTGSFVTNNQTASFVVNSQTSSFILATQTGSFVLETETGSFVTNTQTSSFVTNVQTSSFVFNSQTGSFVLETETGSFAITGSNTFIGNQTISGTLFISGVEESNGTGHVLTYNNTTGKVTFTSSAALGGGTGVPGGSSGQIQYNNAGAFAGVSVLTFNGTNLFATGTFTGSFTGSVFGYVENSQTGSFVLESETGSFVFNSQTSSFVTNTQTASLVTNSQTASFVTNTQTSSFVTNTQTSSFVTNTQTSSFVTNTQTSSFVTNTQTSSFVTNTQTSSFVTNTQTSSFVTNTQTSSFVTNTQTSSFVTNTQTGSFVLESETGSFATTGSNLFRANQFISGTLSIPLMAEPPLGVTIPHTVLFTTGSGQLYYTSSRAIFNSFINTSSFATTGSNIFTSAQIISGSITTTQDITARSGTLFISAALSNGSGHVLTYDNITGKVTYTSSANFAGGVAGQIQYNNSGILGGVSTLTFDGTNLRATGSFTGSFTGSVFGYVENNQTASLVTNSQTASFVTNTQTSSFVTNTQTSSFVTNTQTGSFVTNTQTGSFVTNTQTSSFVTNSQTASFARTGSNTFTGDQTISGSLFVSTSINVFNNEFAVTQTGIKIGNVITDTHTITGSLTISGSTQITGSLNVTGGITGSFSGSIFGYVANSQTASFVTNTQTSSFVTNTQTSSFVTNAQTGSFILEVETGSFAITGSNTFRGNQSISGTLFISGVSVTPSNIGNLLTYDTASGQIYYTSSVVTSPKTKSGVVANTSFTGNPRTATVAFTTPFLNTNYIISITGEDSRAWTTETKTTTGFVINSNSRFPLSGNTFWVASAYGEN